MMNLSRIFLNRLYEKDAVRFSLIFINLEITLLLLLIEDFKIISLLYIKLYYFFFILNNFLRMLFHLLNPHLNLFLTNFSLYLLTDIYNYLNTVNLLKSFLKADLKNISVFFLRIEIYLKTALNV